MFEVPSTQCCDVSLKVQPADKSAPQSQADLKTRGEIIFSSSISSCSRSGLAYIWNIYIPVQQIFRFFCALHIIHVKTVKQDQLQSVIKFTLGTQIISTTTKRKTFARHSSWSEKVPYLRHWCLIMI